VVGFGVTAGAGIADGVDGSGAVDVGDDFDAVFSLPVSVPPAIAIRTIATSRPATMRRVLRTL
jgi:hypothetical protein